MLDSRPILLQEINDWLEEMVEIHGMKKDGRMRAEMFYAGRSEEGRTLKGIKIGSGDEVMCCHVMSCHVKMWEKEICEEPSKESKLEVEIMP